MSFKDVLVWVFARNTKPGSQYLHGDEATKRQVQVERLGRYASNAYHASQA